MHLQTVSTQVSLHSPPRLTWAETFLQLVTCLYVQGHVYLMIKLAVKLGRYFGSYDDLLDIILQRSILTLFPNNKL